MAVESGGHRLAFTPEKVEELLRPELELKDGTITWNDYELTKRFASVNRTYWPALTGTLSTASIVYYGHWYRRRPWSKSSLFLVAPIAYAVGTFPGAIAQMLAVRRFRRDLEDPNGLLEVLGKRVRLISMKHGGDHTHSPEVRASNPPGSGDTPNILQDNQITRDTSKGRWDEIRTASATETRSTWDNIRQAHEQNQTSQSKRSDVSLEGQYDRQTDQAKFDDLLEAERKMSS